MRSRHAALFTLCVIMILSSQTFALVGSGPEISSAPELVFNHETSQTNHTVLFDEAHTSGGSSLMTAGNASLLAWMLEEHGYETDTNFDQHIDSGLLSGFDVFVLMFPMVNLTAAEVTAIHDFVETGGGLLLVGTDDSASTWGFNSANLNPVSETYGISFNLDSWLGSTVDLSTHHLTQDVSSIHVNMDYKLRACTMNVENPAAVVAQGGGNPIAAVAEAGTGRVVAVSAVAPFLMYRHLPQWQTEDDDLFQFSLNIFDWLVGNSPRKVVASETAIITIGNGPSLTPSEYSTYEPYTGIIHDHTTHSDGQGTVEEMVWEGLTKGLDFMVLTDHSYEEPVPTGRDGITGALAARAYSEEHGLDIEQFIGAELSHGHHTSGFPLTENIWASTQEEMVSGIHAQGGIATLCHPTIGAQYMDTYMKFDYYGYDAIEVDNSGFIHGILEEGYFRAYYGASDGHSPEFVGKVVNVMFVNSTSGPDGRLAAEDVVDAILNRRVVIIDEVVDMIYGQQVWVDKYLEMYEEAESALEDARTAVDALIATSNGLPIASFYLQEAEVALSFGGVGKALEAANSALTAEAGSLWIDPIAPAPRVITPNQRFELTLNLTNTGASSLQFNSSVFRSLGSSVDVVTELVSIPSSETLLWNKTVQSTEQGLSLLAINLKEFNNSNLTAVAYIIGSMVDAEPEITTEVAEEESTLTVSLPISRGDFRFLKNATLLYNDGSGVTSKSASIRGTTIDVSLGPYPVNTSITYSFLIHDEYGGVFELSEHSYTVAAEASTTNPSPTGAGTLLTPVILIGAIGGTVAVIAVIVMLGKRRGM